MDVNGPAISGFTLSKAMGLVTMHCAVNTAVRMESPTSVKPINSVDDLQERYPNQFDRIGNLSGKVTLHLKEGATPFIDPLRKYSIHLKPKLKVELDTMEEQGVITRVTEHSDWCSSLATSIKRDGSLRICLDPKKRNTSLKRCPHKMQTIEEISYKFNQALYFSKLDAKSGYWGCELDEDSQPLTTFRTPFGRYMFKKLPFGLNVSQDVFQQKIDQILENCPGTVGIADDIACYGKTAEEHDKNLTNLMFRGHTQWSGVQQQQMHHKKPQIEYYGVVVGSNGIQPDKQKVNDLKVMPTPSTKQELQAFLGLITYLSPFIRDLSAQAEPIRKLLCKETPFEWSEDHQHVFDHLKTLVSAEACLKYYDTNAPTYLMVDASMRGLGAALLQPDMKPGGSKKLCKYTTRNVSHHIRHKATTYLYNRPFTVLSDHKPLEMICNKPLTSAPPRLQAMLLTMQPYDYKVKYLPGKDMGLADALSRLPNSQTTEDMVIDVKVEMLQFSENITNAIKQAINMDPILNELKEIIFTGWPESQEIYLPI